MIDDDKFQIVRRMENCLTSKPLYERIILDRKQMLLQGFTFENKGDQYYQETYCYQMDPSNPSHTLYHAYLFKSPGMRRWIRHRAHNWGVEKLNKIIEKDLQDDLKAKLELTKTKALQLKEKVADKTDKIKEKVVDKKEKLKEKVVDSKEKVKQTLFVMDRSTQMPEKEPSEKKAKQ